MKKLYTLVLAGLLTSNLSHAQLTLTKAANEPVIGDLNNTQGYDSTGVIPKTSGGAQTWNFSAFTTNTVVTANSFTTVVSTPSAASFPLATIAQFAGNGNYTYYQSTASAFELNGFATAALAATFTNNAVAALWPIIYLYNNTDTYAGTVSSGTMSGAANGTITTTAPGNGTVMLPGSLTFSNCLQVKGVNNLKATIPVPIIGNVTVTIVSTDYDYYSGTQKFPIVSVSYQKQTLTSILGPTVTTTATTKINNAVYAGIAENNNSISNLNLYPNPTNGNFYILLNNENSENISVEITNYLGQIVKTLPMENAKGETICPINVSGLNKGIYFVKTILGNKSSTKKLIIE